MGTTYTVVRGDTLWGIATRFYGQGSLFRVIAEANRIANPDRIFPGQVLQIPDLAPPPAPQPPPSPQPPPAPSPQPPPAPQPIEFRILRPNDVVDLRCTAVGFRLTGADSPGGGSVMYTVVAGDTLWDIARRFYGDPRRYPEIAAANRIPNPDLIFPGQVFVIPGLSAPPPPGPPLPPPVPVTYTVVAGDTLWDIARRFYGDPRRYPEIVVANQIPNPDLIFPGQVFVIPGLPAAPPPSAGGEVKDGAKYLVVDSDGAFIVVHFGPQNLFEERDVAQATGGGVARVLAARESRVVFGAPIGTRIEFSAAGVLRALPTLPLRVSPSAKSGDVPPTDLDEVPLPPTEQQTSIEAPFRLVVSPSTRGAFVHDAEPTTAPDDPARVELWSTRLAVRKEANGAFDGFDDDDTQRIVRALHIRDAADGDGTDPPFEGSLNLEQLRTIVAQTSQRSTAIEPAPLSVRKLYLSTLGAWIDWVGRWDSSPKISLYRHLATMGRDAYVRVDTPGFLFPFGHRATWVEVTERRIEPGLDPVARLFARYFIVLRESSVEYSRSDVPFTSVTVSPLITPDLAPPGNPEEVKKPFVPTSPVPPGTSEELPQFPWRITALDHAGAQIKMTTPLVFVPSLIVREGAGNEEIQDLVEVFGKEITDTWAKIGPIDLSGQDVAMAPTQVAGDTTVRVEDVTLNGDVDIRISNGIVDVRHFTSTPFMTSADVSIPALTAFNGGGAPVRVEYAKEYKNGGFGSDGAQVFLVLTPPDVNKPSKLTFGGGSERGGGFIEPTMAVRALSRTLGAISDNNTANGALSRGKFDPTQILAEGVLPKLFGLFNLVDILSEVGLDRAPKLIAEKLNLLESLSSELQRLLAALDRTSGDLATAIPKAAHGAAAQSLQALKARTDSARGQLTGAADPLIAAIEEVLKGRPVEATAQAAAFAGKLAQLDGIVSDPALPAFARAALEKPRAALDGIVATAQTGLAAASSVLRFDWRPEIGPWPPGTVDKPDKQVFIPSKDGLTISVEVRATDGMQPRVDVSAQLAAFELALLPDARLMSLRFSRIGFRVATGRKPEVDVVFDRMEFQGVLSFIEKLRQAIPFDGFADPPYVDIAPAGVTAGFDLAIPSVAVGVFSLENIALSADCRVPFLGEAVTVGFGFCSKDAPFRLTVSAIGGGGWVAIRLSPSGLVALEMGLEAGASLSIDLGVASGSVSVMIGVYLRLEGNKGQLTGYLRIRGEVDVLGLASASITLELSLTYDFDSGKLVGRATLRLEVEVLFFSASVEVSVERRFAGSKGDPKLIETMPPDRGGQRMWESYFGAFAVGA